MPNTDLDKRFSKVINTGAYIYTDEDLPELLKPSSNLTLDYFVVSGPGFTGGPYKSWEEFQKDYNERGPKANDPVVP